MSSQGAEPETPWITAPFWLEGLAEELIIAIIEHLAGDLPTLRNLCRTSGRMQRLSEPVLYRKLFVRKADMAQHHTDRLLAYNGRRQEMIYELEIRAQPAKRHQNVQPSELSAYAELIGTCTKARHLVFESPYCNHGHWRQAEASWSHFVQRLSTHIMPAMTALRKLELHLNGVKDRYWSIHGSVEEQLFANPTLEELTLSCGRFASAMHLPVHDEARARKTPLRILKLIECDVTFDALDRILASPKALQVLELGENRYHERTPGFNGLFSKSEHRFIDVLAMQKHALQKLVYHACDDEAGPRQHNHIENPISLHGFTRLLQLKIVGGSVDTASRFISLAQSVPYTLDKLEVRHTRDIKYLHSARPRSELPGERCVDWLVKIVPLLSSHAREIHCAFHIGYDDGRHIPADCRAALADLEPMLAEKESVLCVYVFGKQYNRFIPPILYGEKGEEDTLVYCSDGRKIRWIEGK